MSTVQVICSLWKCYSTKLLSTLVIEPPSALEFAIAVCPSPYGISFTKP